MVAGGRRISYRALYDMTLVFCGKLKKSGVSKGDIVAAKAAQNADHVVIWLAIHLAGGVVSSLDFN